MKTLTHSALQFAVRMQFVCAACGVREEQVSVVLWGPMGGAAVAERNAGKKAKKEGAGNPAPSAFHLGRNQPLSVIRGEEISLLRIAGGYGKSARSRSPWSGEKSASPRLDVTSIAT